MPRHPRKPGPPKHPRPTDWGKVAEWYDDLVGDAGSEYHREVIFPGVPAGLLRVQAGEKVLDLACGQGAFCRLLAEKGANVSGMDAAAPLVKIARERGPASIAYGVGDARKLDFLAENHFDAVACILALQNIEQLPPVFAGVAALKPVGRFVMEMMHPAFRGPKFTSWGWDDATGVQFRRTDRYLLPRKEPIFTHPGQKTGEYTWEFHRPLQNYVRALRGAGLYVDSLEEWPSHKHSDSGPRAPAENQARREIPMFLAIRAVKFGAVLAEE